MYTFPNKLKNIARVLMLLGFIGLVLGFLGAPKNVAEAKAMAATEHHGEGHGESTDHHEETHVDESHAEKSHAEQTHGGEALGKSHTIVLMMNIYCTSFKTNLGQHFMLPPFSFL